MKLYKKEQQKTILIMEGLSKFQAEEVSRRIKNFSFKDLESLSKGINIIKRGILNKDNTK